MVKPELLAPAGNLEKLKFALVYGADAVYIGGKEFSLRAGADNFSREEIKEGVEFAHKLGKKVYLALNIFIHNKDIDGITDYLRFISSRRVDAVIVSDPAAVRIAKKVAPNLKIHLSTQANTTNWVSCDFWHDHGVSRIILARELGLNEIEEIRQRTSPSLELEIFVHGAMCISYSGRCLMSNYMAYRDSNRGDCAHPCRYRYYLVEEKRPGQYYPVFEDERGTYFFNSKDLCMLDKIPQLASLRLTSFKIEGRMKSVHYVAQVTKLYRQVIDEYYKNPQDFRFSDEWIKELRKVTHREFTHGFLYGKPDCLDQTYESSSYLAEYDLVGVVLYYDKTTGFATVEERNPLNRGDVIEFLNPKGKNYRQKITELFDNEGNRIERAAHPKQIFRIKTDFPSSQFTILRRPRNNAPF
ncbi:MAG: peptidase U32 family protein [Tepidanaerobacteraceae bacterium]|jgi:putative protease